MHMRYKVHQRSQKRIVFNLPTSRGKKHFWGQPNKNYGFFTTDQQQQKKRRVYLCKKRNLVNFNKLLNCSTFEDNSRDFQKQHQNIYRFKTQIDQNTQNDEQKFDQNCQKRLFNRKNNYSIQNLHPSINKQARNIYQQSKQEIDKELLNLSLQKIPNKKQYFQQNNLSKNQKLVNPQQAELNKENKIKKNRRVLKIQKTTDIFLPQIKQVYQKKNNIQQDMLDNNNQQKHKSDNIQQLNLQKQKKQLKSIRNLSFQLENYRKYRLNNNQFRKYIQTSRYSPTYISSLGNPFVRIYTQDASSIDS